MQFVKHRKLGWCNLSVLIIGAVENIRCGNNDLRLGFHVAEWNGLCGDTMFVLCGDEDHN